MLCFVSLPLDHYRWIWSDFVPRISLTESSVPHYKGPWVYDLRLPVNSEYIHRILLSTGSLSFDCYPFRYGSTFGG
jgi:hypothetical protein